MNWSSENIKDLATWVVVLLGAQVAAMQSADLSTGHGKIVAASAALGILAAALKSMPNFT